MLPSLLTSQGLLLASLRACGTGTLSLLQRRAFAAQVATVAYNSTVEEEASRYRSHLLVPRFKALLVDAAGGCMAAELVRDTGNSRDSSSQGWQWGQAPQLGCMQRVHTPSLLRSPCAGTLLSPSEPAAQVCTKRPTLPPGAGSVQLSSLHRWLGVRPGLQRNELGIREGKQPRLSALPYLLHLPTHPPLPCLPCHHTAGLPAICCARWRMHERDGRVALLSQSVQHAVGEVHDSLRGGWEALLVRWRQKEHTGWCVLWGEALCVEG